MKSKKTPARRKPSTAMAVRAGRPIIAPAAVVSHQEGFTKLANIGPGLDYLNLLGEEVALGALGLVEVKLTDEEEAVLNRPVDIETILIKPTGQPYLSHPTYTHWFNAAFGRLGWSIVPRSKPRLDGPSVVCPYILYIHGQAAAFAYGEQEYHASNREQTYGDAIEATVASALRRCAKRLGVGLELWDKAFLNQFIAERCVKVFLTPRAGDSDTRVAWRLKRDAPFWNESGIAQQPKPPIRKPVNAGTDAMQDEPISVPQRKRLWAILRNSARDEAAVKAWLAVAYDVDSTKLIKRKDYEAVCNAIEASGPLGVPSREPGEDG
jgi:hypothetical protein